MNVLLFAIGKQKIEIIEFLLDNGYDVNFRNTYSDLPLVYAVHYNYEVIVDVLLRYSPDLELRSWKVLKFFKNI